MSQPHDASLILFGMTDPATLSRIAAVAAPLGLDMSGGPMERALNGDAAFYFIADKPDMPEPLRHALTISGLFFEYATTWHDQPRDRAISHVEVYNPFREHGVLCQARGEGRERIIVPLINTLRHAEILESWPRPDQVTRSAPGAGLVVVRSNHEALRLRDDPRLPQGAFAAYMAARENRHAA